MIMHSSSEHDGHLDNCQLNAFGCQALCKNTITENWVYTGLPKFETLLHAESMFANKPSAQAMEGHFHQSQSVSHAIIFEILI